MHPETIAPRTGLLCRLGFHAARPSTVWNDGHFFSSCSRCDVPMVRRPEEKWRPVPAGLRVVWRPRTKDDVIWPTNTF